MRIIMILAAVTSLLVESGRLIHSASTAPSPSNLELGLPHSSATELHLS